MKRLLIIVLGILLLVAIPVTVFVAMRQQELRKRAAPATTLFLSPSSVTKKVGETFSLEVRIDTGENQVVAAEIHLVFNPEKLEAQSVTNGPLFPNILSSGVVDQGSAAIAVGAASASTPVTGGGTAAVIRFKALSPTASPVSVRFASNTFVGSLGEGATNVLVGTTPATITLITDPSTSSTTATSSAQLTSTFSQTTGGGSATPSALTITSPTDDENLTDDLPTFQGQAPPGATVTITIYSNPITATVVADEDGNWSFSPTTPLNSGPHSVVVSAQDPQTDQAQTATVSFVVAAGESSLEATDSGVPIAGTWETTIMLLTIGIIFIMIGFTIPAVL